MKKYIFTMIFIIFLISLYLISKHNFVKTENSNNNLEKIEIHNTTQNNKYQPKIIYPIYKGESINIINPIYKGEPIIIEKLNK